MYRVRLFLILLLLSVLTPLVQAQEGVAKRAVDQAFNPPKEKKSKKKKQKIPLKINFGFGLSQYRLFDVYDVPEGAEEQQPLIFGTEISLAGVVENSTIRMFKDKVPPKYRKIVLGLREVSATHLFIPKTLYIQPKNSKGIEAYGITWGLVPGLGLGPFFLRGGVILTYLHYRDFAFEEPVNFIRPGLRGVAGMKFHMFKNNFVLEVGGKGDIYAPQRFYADSTEKDLWNIRGVYVQLNFRYPIEVEAEI